MKQFFYIFSFCVILTSCNLSQTHYTVEGMSMLPTLSIKNHLKIIRNIEQFNYGDIVVYNYNGKITEHYEMQGTFVSRIVGLPGDSIAVENNICIINGKKNNSKLIRKGTSNRDIDKIDRKYIEEYEEFFPNEVTIRIFKYSAKFFADFSDKDIGNMITIKIPENHYFLMGDFRCNAIDSRSYGVMPKEQIIGKVIKITPKKK